MNLNGQNIWSFPVSLFQHFPSCSLGSGLSSEGSWEDIKGHLHPETESLLWCGVLARRVLMALPQPPGLGNLSCSPLTWKLYSPNQQQN